MPQSQTERKRAERVRKRRAGLVPVQVWLPRKQPQNVRDTLQYIREEIAHGSEITLDAQDARELLEYFGAADQSTAASSAGESRG